MLLLRLHFSISFSTNDYIRFATQKTKEKKKAKQEIYKPLVGSDCLNVKENGLFVHTLKLAFKTYIVPMYFLKNDVSETNHEKQKEATRLSPTGLKQCSM